MFADSFCKFEIEKITYEKFIHNYISFNFSNWM